jgi:hypothetical protein
VTVHGEEEGGQEEEGQVERSSDRCDCRSREGGDISMAKKKAAKKKNN